MKNRFVLVAIDKGSGRVYVSPETLREEFTKEEVEQIAKFMPSSLKEVRDFYVMPYDKAVGLWWQEQNEQDKGKDKRTIH